MIQAGGKGVNVSNQECICNKLRIKRILLGNEKPLQPVG
jgi:hypothetical protein